MEAVRFSLHRQSSRVLVALAATAGTSAHVYLGTAVEFEVAGRDAVGGDFGAQLDSAHDAATGCTTTTAGLADNLTVPDGELVPSLDALPTGTFGPSQTLTTC